MSIDSKSATRNYLLKPAASAAVAAGATYAVWGNIPAVIPGMGQYSLPLVVAATTFLASEAVALINEQLFPHVPVINALQAPAHTALSVGALTATSALVENFVSPGLVGDLGLAQMAGFALVAEVGGTYLVDEWVVPMYNKYSTANSSY